MILISFWARHTKRTQKWTMVALTLDLNFPFDALVQVDESFDIEMVLVLVPLLFPTVLMQMCSCTGKWKFCYPNGSRFGSFTVSNCFYADVLCLLLFLAFLAGWGAVAYIGLRSQTSTNLSFLKPTNPPMWIDQ